MSLEKSTRVRQSLKMPQLPTTSHSRAKRTGQNLTLSSALYEPHPPLAALKPVLQSPANLNSARKRIPRALNSTAGVAANVPGLQLKNLSFNGSAINSPMSSNRTIEAISSTRNRRVGQFVFATAPPLELPTHVQFPDPGASPKRTVIRPLSRDLCEEGNDKQPEVVYPITAAQALKLFSDRLSDYEKGEILDHQQIYFLGLDAAKVKGSAGQLNYGYDDDRGDYTLTIGDQVLYQYEILSLLGKGSFGQVCKCFDHKSKELVALKIIRNKRRFHQQGLVEVKVLEHLRVHDIEDRMCVVKIRQSFLFRKHLCLTFELLSINLYEFLKANDFSGLSLNLVRRFAIQVLIALKYSKANGVIHCDLKPENILLKQQNKSGIKVIDFGSACFENERIYTYIQSRFYRAPEIILGIPYTTCIDMWSFGCIMAELYTGYPLFPGENEQEQLLCIMEVLGVPPETLLDQSSRRKLFFDGENNPKIVPNSRGKKRNPSTKTLQGVVQCPDPYFLDLIGKCLTWSPEARYSPEQALKHQWVLDGIAKMQQEQSRQSSETRASDHSKRL